MTLRRYIDSSEMSIVGPPPPGVAFFFAQKERARQMSWGEGLCRALGFVQTLNISICFKLLERPPTWAGCCLFPVPHRNGASSVLLLVRRPESYRYSSRCSPLCSAVIMHQAPLEESVPKVRKVVATWRVYQVGHRDLPVTGPSVLFQNRALF